MSEPSEGTVDIEEGRRLLDAMTHGPSVIASNPNEGHWAYSLGETHQQDVTCYIHDEAQTYQKRDSRAGDNALGIVWLRNNASALLALAEQPCPHVVISDEGTSYCDLAESSALLARIEELTADLAIANERGDAWREMVRADLAAQSAAEARCAALTDALRDAQEKYVVHRFECHATADYRDHREPMRPCSCGLMDWNAAARALLSHEGESQ